MGRNLLLYRNKSYVPNHKPKGYVCILSSSMVITIIDFLDVSLQGTLGDTNFYINNSPINKFHLFQIVGHLKPQHHF